MYRKPRSKKFKWTNPTDKPILPDAAIQHISETGQQHAADNVQANFANDLAVAFTDVNGDHTFEANTDQLIAAVVDTNKDNVVDAGDTVQFGTYPLHLDGTGVGNFLEKSETITQVFQDSPNVVLVGVADGAIIWSTDATTHGWSTSTGIGTGQLGIGLGDNLTTSENDTITAHAGVGPGMPDTTVAESAFQPGDQPFVDVFIA